MVGFGVFFDLRLNKTLSKQSGRWWFETPLLWLWRRCNGLHLHMLCVSWFGAAVCTALGLVSVVLTHWGRDKIDAISQTTCSSAFSLLLCCCFLFACFVWNNIFSHPTVKDISFPAVTFSGMPNCTKFLSCLHWKKGVQWTTTTLSP